MSTLKTIQRFNNQLVNINWFVFGGVALTVGMAILSGHIAWYVISLPLVWAFGLFSGAVLGGKVFEKRAQQDINDNNDG